MLSGFSAGGSISLGFCAQSIATKYGLTQAQFDSIKAGILFYPATGATTEARLGSPNAKDTAYLQEHGIPGVAFDAKTLDLFSGAYLWGSDHEQAGKLPEIAPGPHDASLWTRPMTFITCEYDVLEQEASDFAKKLQAAGQDVELMVTKGTSHGWESRVTHNEADWIEQVKGGVAKKESYALVEKRIKKALNL